MGMDMRMELGLCAFNLFYLIKPVRDGARMIIR